VGIPETRKIGFSRDAIAMHMIRLSIIFALFQLKIRNTKYSLCALVELLSSGKAKIKSKTLNIKKNFSLARTFRRLLGLYSLVKSI
jgi:hypothetical protein